MRMSCEHHVRRYDTLKICTRLRNINHPWRYQYLVHINQDQGFRHLFMKKDSKCWSGKLFFEMEKPTWKKYANTLGTILEAFWSCRVKAECSRRMEFRKEILAIRCDWRSDRVTEQTKSHENIEETK